MRKSRKGRAKNKIVSTSETGSAEQIHGTKSGPQVPSEYSQHTNTYRRPNKHTDTQTRSNTRTHIYIHTYMYPEHCFSRQHPPKVLYLQGPLWVPASRRTQLGAPLESVEVCRVAVHSPGTAMRSSTRMEQVTQKLARESHLHALNACSRNTPHACY